MMIEGSTVMGVGMLFGGMALGAGAISFVERQGERTNERGVVSDETRSRMAAMFMEDEELATDLDDTIDKMEAALAEAEGREAIKGDGLSEEEKESLRDDWGD